MKTVSLTFTKKQLFIIQLALAERAEKLPGFVQGVESKKNNFFQDLLAQIEQAIDENFYQEKN